MTSNTGRMDVSKMSSSVANGTLHFGKWAPVACAWQTDCYEPLEQYVRLGISSGVAELIARGECRSSMVTDVRAATS
ncbi:hypothetical protein G3545_06290 [Starkeya sp. ORNL1]|uniref:hypothetical protein n=1 Tax=Starkeya sp. ORNL1 TaxID=2709380 RepID=UPI00146369C1|nr:hypothetical protein [Starkeya sp. ORNL1]QJP13294.1 hypothetical protein G3545_06290 [Starkeya sp. ORNL1]